MLALHEIPVEDVRGALMGGYFPGLLNQEVLATSLDHETQRAIGSGLGCGAVSVLTEECPVAAEALRDGGATADDVARLRRWSAVLRGRGACATLDAATNIAASLLEKFPAEVARHLDNTCDDCRAGVVEVLRPFAEEPGPSEVQVHQ